MIRKHQFEEMLAERLNDINQKFQTIPKYSSLKSDEESAREDLEKFKDLLPEEHRDGFRKALNKYTDKAGDVESAFTDLVQHESFKDGFHFNKTIE